MLPAAMRFYVFDGRRTHGPFELEHVVQEIETGRLRPDSEVCPEGSARWVRIDAHPIFRESSDWAEISSLPFAAPRASERELPSSPAR